MREKTDSSTSPRTVGFGAALAVVLALLLFIGRCRGTGDGVEVYGRVVNEDGDGLPAGLIFFTPATKTDGPAAGGRITDGAYRIAFEAESVNGEYNVRITTGEPGPPGGGGGRLTPEKPPERSLSYFYTRILAASTREQDFTLTQEARRSRRLGQ
ncbi:MAG: hypothetical protein AB7I48_23270 [Planctomycetaceae bacterium]